MPFPDSNSTQLLFFGKRFDAYIYSSAEDSRHKLPLSESAAHVRYP